MKNQKQVSRMISSAFAYELDDRTGKVSKCYGQFEEMYMEADEI